jgi:putative FmdB family regulatory protein
MAFSATSEVIQLPTYEFECTCCPSRFELKRGFHEEGPVNCPGCGGKAKRRFSSVPIIFKGSGFYVTDSRGGESFVSGTNPAETKTAATETAGASTPPQAVKSEAKVGPGKDKGEAKAAAGKDTGAAVGPAKAKVSAGRNDD